MSTHGADFAPDSPEGFTFASPEVLAELSVQAKELWSSAEHLAGLDRGPLKVTFDDVVAGFDIQPDPRLANARTKMLIYEDPEDTMTVAYEAYSPTYEMDGQVGSITRITRTHPLDAGRTSSERKEIGRLNDIGYFEVDEAQPEVALSPVSVTKSESIAADLGALHALLMLSKELPSPSPRRSGVGRWLGGLLRRFLG